MHSFSNSALRFWAAWVFFLGMGCGLGFGQEFDWKWQNPLPTGNWLSDVYFINAQTGWAVGSAGTIMKTSNGGSSWSLQTSGTTIFLKSVHFTDAQTGWAVGDNGTILKTSNGGSSWQSQTSGTQFGLSSVHFTDAQTGWAVGDFGTILKTNNGGSSWISQISGTNKHLFTVHFTDGQTGWVVGWGGPIVKTSDGGQSWQSQYSSTGNHLYSVHFTDSQTGWAVGSAGTKMKTSNGGSNWISQTSGTNKDLFSVHFTDAQTGWAVGNEGTILKTSDGGSSWISQTSGTTLTLSSVHFTDAQTGWAVGSAGTILKTSNGGNSWQSQTSGTVVSHLTSLHFTDAQTGWAVGQAGTILKTSNGGNSWQSQTSGTANGLSSVYFTDGQTGWAVGYYGTMLKTTNGGSNWISQISGTNKHLFSVHFTDAQTGWAVGYIGTILKTSNGGQSWQSQGSGPANNLYSVHFTDAQTGWAVGNNGTILKTSNGGSTWSSQTSGTTNSLYSIHFTDAQTGWAVGYFGTILKTSNGGSSWQSQTSGTPYVLSSVHFIEAQTGWAVGDYGTILKTSNGGSSWQSQSSGTTQWLFSVHFTDPLHGWAVGDYGTILTTITNNPIDPETPTSLIQGKLFEKSGSNCAPSSLPVQGKFVKATPGPYYGISNASGDYELRLPLGNIASTYNLEALPFGSQAFQGQPVCPPGNSYSLSLDTIPDTLSGKDFGFQIPQCHFLTIELSSNRRRRCFKNSTSVSYANQGSVAANNAYIFLNFPRWVRGVSASRPYTALNDSTWRFDLGTVQPGTGGDISIVDSVICGFPDIRNLTQCTKATIFPASDCPPSGNWNGADLVVSGGCVNGIVRMAINNQGTGNMLDSTGYAVMMDSILVRSGKVKLAAGDSLVLQVQPQNMAVTLSVVQVPNHPSNYFLSTTVQSCFLPLSMGQASANHFPKTQIANAKIHCLPIRDSYDPNDKQAFPIGFNPNHVVKPGTEMEYLVRFQNTGNDTAYNVYVIDSLDRNLNVESLEIGAVSHPYQLTLQTNKHGRNFLRFQFNNILLPDSNTNELKSHGFIQYRISPNAGLALGSQVRNEAEIYFDFNPPVITNRTLTTFDNLVFTNPSLNNNVQIVTSKAQQLAAFGVKLYPNPVKYQSLTVEFEHPGSLTLTDALGRVVFYQDQILGTAHLPLLLKPGFYFAKAHTAMSNFTVKLVVD